MTLSTLFRRTFAAVLVTAAFSFPVHRAAAQGDREMQTLANYRLTESGLRKYYKAMGNMTKAVRNDPALAETLENVGSTDDEDIAAMAAKYDHIPALKSALASAAITSTEFTTFVLSYMQAGVAYSLMTQGPEKFRLKELPKGTPKENVDFIGTHQQLIQQLDKELKALQAPGSEQGAPLR